MSNLVSTSASAPHLAVRGLACERGPRRVFEHVEFEVRPRELVWLKGQNGRGKTSLLRLVAGVSPALEGRVEFDGVPIAERSTAASPAIFIAHANALKDDLTAAEALAFLLQIHRCDASEEAIDGALAEWDMLEQRHALVRTLSQGQRRRVALARLSIAAPPTLWILDEPFDSLDADGVRRLNELLDKHLRRGGSALVTGHQAALHAALPSRDFDLDRCAA